MNSIAIALFVLAQAANEGEFARVKERVAKGADINARGAKGDTPLIAAVNLWARMRYGHNVDTQLEITRYLLDHGAQIDATNAAGRTALLESVIGHASEHGIVGANEAIVRLLLDRGANVNARDPDGASPLLDLMKQWADRDQIADMLIARGADVNAANKEGITALMYAASRSKDKTVRALLAKGAKVNARDAKGKTALMHAAAGNWEEHTETCKILLDHGADSKIQDSAGKTAADYARDTGHELRAKLLFR